LNVVDEFTREALATEVDRSIDADHVVAILDKIAGERGYPAYLRFDNGPEFVAFAIADWCRFNAATTIFIEPGSPPLSGQYSGQHQQNRSIFIGNPPPCAPELIRTVHDE
jgi:putative transposase